MDQDSRGQTDPMVTQINTESSNIDHEEQDGAYSLIADLSTSNLVIGKGGSNQPLNIID